MVSAAAVRKAVPERIMVPAPVALLPRVRGPPLIVWKPPDRLSDADAEPPTVSMLVVIAPSDWLSVIRPAALVASRVSDSRLVTLAAASKVTVTLPPGEFRRT